MSNRFTYTKHLRKFIKNINQWTVIDKDKTFVPIRNDKSNDSGNEMVKVCSNRTTITKEHKIVIVGNSQSRGCAMRVKNYENNKLNGLVKPGTGVYISEFCKERNCEFNEKSCDCFLSWCQCCG